MADTSTGSEDHSHSHHEHHHGHDGSHPHQDSEAFTEANRAHWNNFAASYSSEQWQRDLLQKVTAFIHQHVNWIGVDFLDPATTFERKAPTSSDAADEPQRRVRVLDYACGPGTITHALGARASEYVGVDLSENMVKAYNLRFNPEASQRDEAEEDDETLNAHAVVGNLLARDDPPASLSDSKFFNFDLVVVGLGYHHFQDIAHATKRLVERLRPGGVFLILDFVTHAMEEAHNAKEGGAAAAEEETTHHHHHHQNPSAHTVAHNGFSEEELRDWFEGAGLTEFKLVRMHDEVLIRGTMRREPFLARGRKI